MAVPIESEPIFRPGTPEALFQGNYRAVDVGRHAYGVSPDGQRFLMIKDDGGGSEDEGPQIVIVENWFEELERLAPAAK